MTVSTQTVSDAAVQAFCENYYGWWSKDAKGIVRQNVMQNVIRSLTAALPHLVLSSASCSVEVKRLEWGQTSFGTPEVFSAVGVYRIVSAWNGGWSLTRNNNTILDHDGRSNFPTIEAAKAAAQADFDRRILSQIVTKPVDVAAVREQAFEINFMQRVWANLYFDEHDAGYTFQQTLNDVVDWLTSRNALPDAEAIKPSAIRALSPAEPAQGEQWQDIATAPKDGTFFITVNTGEIERWHTFKDGEIISVKANDRPFMCSSFSDEDGTPLFMDDFGEAYTLDGIVIDADELTAADNVLRLTHWMPLPAAPALSSGRTTEGGEG